MPNARARLAPTTSMISAPTTARMICVCTTAGCRSGVPRRRGRNARTVPSSAARGRRMADASSSSCRLSITPGRSTVGSISASRPLRLECEPFLNLGFYLAGVTAADLRRDGRAGEQIGPLLIGNAIEQVADPHYVGRCNLAQQVFVPRVIVKLDAPLLDAEHQFLRFKVLDVVAVADRPGGLAKRGADVLHHEPLRRVLDFRVDAVLAWLQIPVVDDQVGDDQSLQLARLQERIVGPRPFAGGIVIRAQAKPPRV